MLHRLLRYNERLLQKIGALYGLFDRQRVVCPHQEPPGIVVRDAAKRIRPRCIRPADEPEVEQSLLQRIVDQVFIAADQMELDVRIGSAQRRQDFRDTGHRLRLAGTNVDVPRHELIHLGKLLLRLFCQAENLLRSRLEYQSGFRQLRLALPAHEQLHAQFVLEIRQLPRKRRLRQVKFLRRLGDVLMPGYRHKVLQYAYLHSPTPPSSSMIGTLPLLYTQSRNIEKK